MAAEPLGGRKMLSKISSAAFHVSQHLCTELHSQMCLCNDFDSFPFSTSLLLEKQTHTEPFHRLQVHVGWGMEQDCRAINIPCCGCRESEHQVHTAVKTHLWWHWCYKIRWVWEGVSSLSELERLLSWGFPPLPTLLSCLGFKCHSLSIYLFTSTVLVKQFQLNIFLILPHP